MKVRYFFIALFFLTLPTLGQVKTNIWELGYNQGGGCFYLNFDSIPVSINTVSRIMNFRETNASICNAAGEMNFYTNGIFIANRNNDTLLNGADLNPSAYTSTWSQNGLHFSQGDIIIPFPDDTTKFYLFHETVYWLGSSYQPLELYETVIDMTLDGGLGGVTLKNNPILQDTLYVGEVTACKHANGRDWWLICHRFQSDLFYKFLITPFGVQNPIIQNIGSNLLYGSGGQSCFSPDGKWYARYNPYDTDLDIMNFDRCSGDFSNYINVNFNDTSGAGGVAFSPNSKVLYVSSDRYVYQFDLANSNIASTQKTVAVWDGYYSPQPPFACTFYLAQLAPDNKIYINSNNSVVDMHVINYPDSLDTLCNVCQHCIHLPSYNGVTIPNHPNYNLGADTTSIICDSLTLASSNSFRAKEINIFPVPANRILYVSLPSGFKPHGIKIINTLGQQMNVNIALIKNNEYAKINVASLPPGIYFLKLLSEKEKVVKKFVKE